jgi:hypothetical protein
MTLDEIIAAFARGGITHISLDHDLGLWGDVETPYGVSYKEINGRVIIDWMASNNMWPSEWINVHSANPDGVDYMCKVIGNCTNLTPNRMSDLAVYAKFGV